jgi:AraC-like DNA-binding protein
MVSVIQLTFNDPRDYERGVRLGKVSDLVISERGEFSAALTIMNVGRVWLQSGNDNLARTLYVAIESPRRSLMFLADSQAAPVIQSGGEFGAGDMVSLGQNTSHFQRTFGPIQWAGMSLPPSWLEDTARAIFGRDIEDSSASLWVKPSAVNLNRLRQLHHETRQMALIGDTSLNHPEVVRSLEQALTVAMVACITDRTDGSRGSGWHRHDQIMQRFREWLDTNDDRAVYLQEVCAAHNVSAPTLRRCCEEHLGTSPMRYLWLRRMNLARQELRGGHSPTSVTKTATNFGFWHLGRFADNYCSLFGETPSATLVRSSPSLARANAYGIGRALG